MTSGTDFATTFGNCVEVLQHICDSGTTDDIVTNNGIQSYYNSSHYHIIKVHE